MDEPPLPVETSLQHDGVDVGIEPDKFSRRSVVERLDDPVDQAGDLAVQLPVVTEEDA